MATKTTNSANETKARGTVHLAALATLSLTTVVVIGALTSLGRDELDAVDVVFEGAVAILSLVWLIIIHRAAHPKHIHVPFVLGLSLLFGAFLKDAVDEFVDFGDIYDYLEHVGSSVGMMLTAFGLFRWVVMLRNEKSVLEDAVRKRTLHLERSNELLEVAAAEKELLVKEIHHRVKNNLQIIGSLLRLQQRRNADRQTADILNTA